MSYAQLSQRSRDNILTTSEIVLMKNFRQRTSGNRQPLAFLHFHRRLLYTTSHFFKMARQIVASKFKRVFVRHRNRRILFHSGFFGSLDAQRSERAWIDLLSKEDILDFLKETLI